jgi:hypothetical protein
LIFNDPWHGISEATVSNEEEYKITYSEEKLKNKKSTIPTSKK